MKLNRGKPGDRKEETSNRKKPGVSDDSFSALRHPEEALLHSYETHVLCPQNLCRLSEIDSGRGFDLHPIRAVQRLPI